MSSNGPRDAESGRILQFRRRMSRAPRPAQPDQPVEGVEKYARTEPDDYRQRMINNGLGLLACILLVIGGIWIANTMAQMRKNQDCVLSGRQGCTPVNVPASSR